MFISRHTLKWTKTCRSSGDFPHAHTAHFLLNRHIPWPVSSTPIDVRPSNSDGIPALGRPDPAERCRPRRAMRYAGDHSRSSG